MRNYFLIFLQHGALGLSPQSKVFQVFTLYFLIDWVYLDPEMPSSRLS